MIENSVFIIKKWHVLEKPSLSIIIFVMTLKKDNLDSIFIKMLSDFFRIQIFRHLMMDVKFVFKWRNIIFNRTFKVFRRFFNHMYFGQKYFKTFVQRFFVIFLKHRKSFQCIAWKHSGVSTFLRFFQLIFCGYKLDAEVTI